MTRADFIVADSNARAFAFMESYPGWPAPAAALYGPSASGKTHLARIWAERSGAALLDARTLDISTGGEPVRGAAVVENVDSATGFAHEPALFAMLEQGTPLLLTGRSAPSSWLAALPDLKSRFRAMLAFELGGAIAPAGGRNAGGETLIKASGIDGDGGAEAAAHDANARGIHIGMALQQGHGVARVAHLLEADETPMLAFALAAAAHVEAHGHIAQTIEHGGGRHHIAGLLRAAESMKNDEGGALFAGGEPFRQADRSR